MKRRALPRRPDKISAIEDTYNKWWSGKTVKIRYYDEIIEVAKVKYYGNSVYGNAVLIDRNGKEHPVYSRSYRTRKKDVIVMPE